MNAYYPVTSFIRPFEVEHASAVSALFRTVYGENYVYPDVYLPSMIRHRNATGSWHSAIAVQDGQVVGHAVLWRDTHCPENAELALNVVHPSVRGQGIATLLGRYLCKQANDLGLSMLTMKQVSTHSQSQRLAKTLGFQTTALLLDYVESPFGQSQAESIVLGCLPLQNRPFPRVQWPMSWGGWQVPISHMFDSAPALALSNTSVDTEIFDYGYRLEVDLHITLPERVEEIAALPVGRLIYVKLVLDQGTLQAIQILQQAGFTCAGFVPGADRSWQVLLLRGYRHQSLEFFCPVASQLLSLIHSHG